MRSGEIVAMVRTLSTSLMHLISIKFAVIGHDWGARIAYALAIAFPQRILRIVTLPVGCNRASCRPRASNRLKRTGTSGS
jgi:pimeloyl-ACP methyl ester carboxylesterase